MKPEPHLKMRQNAGQFWTDVSHQPHLVLLVVVLFINSCEYINPVLNYLKFYVHVHVGPKFNDYDMITACTYTLCMFDC